MRRRLKRRLFFLIERNPFFLLEIQKSPISIDSFRFCAFLVRIYCKKMKSWKNDKWQNRSNPATQS